MHHPRLGKGKGGGRGREEERHGGCNYEYWHSHYLKAAIMRSDHAISSMRAICAWICSISRVSVSHFSASFFRTSSGTLPA